MLANLRHACVAAGFSAFLAPHNTIVPTLRRSGLAKQKHLPAVPRLVAAACCPGTGRARQQKMAISDTRTIVEGPVRISCPPAAAAL